MRSILEQRAFPLDYLRLFASARSVGTTLGFRGDESRSQDAASAADYAGLDLRCSAAGGHFARLAPAPRSPGRHRHRQLLGVAHGPDVPLVVPEVNAAALRSIPKGIVANPNCTTMVAMPVLKPLHDAAGLRAVIVSTYQSVSGSGRRGSRSSRSQLADRGRGSGARPSRRRGRLPGRTRSSPRPIAYNVIPLAGPIVDDGTGRPTRSRSFATRAARSSTSLRSLSTASACGFPSSPGHSLDHRVASSAPFPPSGRPSCSTLLPASSSPRSPRPCRPQAVTPARRAHPP